VKYSDPLAVEHQTRQVLEQIRRLDDEEAAKDTPASALLRP